MQLILKIAIDPQKWYYRFGYGRIQTWFLHTPSSSSTNARRIPTTGRIPIGAGPQDFLQRLRHGKFHPFAGSKQCIAGRKSLSALLKTAEKRLPITGERRLGIRTEKGDQSGP